MKRCYDCIVIDPPWQYRKPQTGGTLKSGASQKYLTMSFDELRKLQDQIEDVTADNCVCFIWATNPFLYEAMSLLGSYFFEYKTMITWIKKNNGLGYYFRGKTEHLLVGTRGKVKAFHSQRPNVIITDRILKHSEKPIESYDLIDEVIKKSFDDPSVLELFARRQYKNWKCIGYDMDGKDIRESLSSLLLLNPPCEETVYARDQLSTL